MRMRRTHTLRAARVKGLAAPRQGPAGGAAQGWGRQLPGVWREFIKTAASDGIPGDRSFAGPNANRPAAPPWSDRPAVIQPAPWRLQSPGRQTVARGLGRICRNRRFCRSERRSSGQGLTNAPTHPARPAHRPIDGRPLCRVFTWQRRFILPAHQHRPRDQRATRQPPGPPPDRRSKQTVVMGWWTIARNHTSRRRPAIRAPNPLAAPQARIHTTEPQRHREAGSRGRSYHWPPRDAAQCAPAPFSVPLCLLCRSLPERAVHPMVLAWPAARS